MIADPSSFSSLQKAQVLVAVCHSRPFASGRIAWGYRQSAGGWRIGCSIARIGAPGAWAHSVADLQQALAVLLALEKFDAGFEYVKWLALDEPTKAAPEAAEAASERFLHPGPDAESCGEVESAYAILEAFSPGCVPRPAAGTSANAWYYQINAAGELDLRGIAHSLPEVVIPRESILKGPAEETRRPRKQPGM
jgi:hypothetical protein